MPGAAMMRIPEGIAKPVESYPACCTNSVV